MNLSDLRAKLWLLSLPRIAYTGRLNNRKNNPMGGRMKTHHSRLALA